MTNIVLIGSDRIGLARTRDALDKTGYQVEVGADLSDASILIRAVSADILVVDVGDGIPGDLSMLETLIEHEPDLEVVLVLGPMPPPTEQELMAATRSLGVQVHLPRQLTNTSFFPSVMSVVADRARLRRTIKKLEDDLAVLRAARSRLQTQDAVVPDYSYLQEQLERELSTGSDVSLMMIGIDDFDEIQQKRGRQAAEQLLQELADLLQSDLRDSDVVTRTDTMEKLAVILPMTDAAHAKIVASRIQVKLARRSLGIASISAGIVEAGAGMDADELIRRADEAWQQAQQTEERLVMLTETSS
ncbi:MAG: diguanylate cyclase domain-containing protein [Anaerolineae bacterium]